MLLCKDQNVIFIANMDAEYSRGTNLFVILYSVKGVVLVFRNLYIFVHGQKCYYFYREDGGRRFFRSINKYQPD